MQAIRPGAEESHLAVVILAIMILIVSVSAIIFIHHRADEMSNTDRLLFSLGKEINRLDSLEWQARDGEVDSNLEAEIDKQKRAVQSILRRLSVQDPGITGFGEILREYVSYERALDMELNSVRMGRTDEAWRIDDTMTDQAFRSLYQQVNLVSGLYDTLAKGAQKNSRLWTAVIGFITLFILFLMIWVYHRFWVRTQNLKAEQLARKKQEKVQEELKRYRVLAEHARDIILFVDMEGRIYEANQAAVNTYGYSKEELLTMKIHRLRRDTEEVAEQMKKSSEDNILFETIHRRKDGSLFPVEVSSKGTFVNGKLILLSIIRDITSRRKQQEALQEQKIFSENLIQNATVPVFVLDPNHKVIIWNKACEDLTGVSSESIIGTSGHWQGFYTAPRPCLADFVIDGDFRQLKDYYSLYANSERVNGIYCEGWFSSASGRRFYLYADAAPVYDSKGELVAVVETVQNITERVRAIEELERAKKEAERANEVKSQFLANMSHEIRTPMNGIIGAADIVLSMDLNKEQKEYLELLKGSADSLLGLINEILDFSKLEAQKLELELTEMNISKIIGDVTNKCLPLVHNKGLELVCYIDSGVPPTLTGDPHRLKQVLTNLIGNAIKFTESGRIEVAVRVTGPDHNDGRDCRKPSQLLFAVEDTGIGIPQDKRDRLFKSFSQVDGSITRKYGGTGLGLAISEQIVKLMGGSIWFESAEGKGTTFYFTLPFNQVNCDKDTNDLATASMELKNRLFKKYPALTKDDSGLYS